MVGINFEALQRDLRACTVTLPNGARCNAEHVLVWIGDARKKGRPWSPKDDAEHAALLPCLMKLVEHGLIDRVPAAPSSSG